MWTVQDNGKRMQQLKLAVLPGAALLTLVTPGLQILRLKEQAVLLYCRESLGGCYFALNGERLVRQAKRLKLAGGDIHAREALAANVKDRQAAGRRPRHKHGCGVGRGCNRLSRR